MKIGNVLSELKKNSFPTKYVLINKKTYFIKPTILGVNELRSKLIREGYDIEETEKVINDIKLLFQTINGRKFVKENDCLGKYNLEE